MFMSTILILVVVGLVAYAMLKRFNPQATLLTAGLVLLAYAQWAGISSILPAENSQGFWFFDLWEKFAMVTNSRLASTGLTLVAIHLVGINVTGVSVNPARSFGPAIFVGGKAMADLWVFIAAPLAGGALAGILHGMGITRSINAAPTGR